MMKSAARILLFLALFFLPVEGRALDPANDQALRDTQQMLTDPAQRQKALDGDPRAQAMDKAARQVVGDQNATDIYALASDLMATLAQESGGDPIKMMELLQQAQKDPGSLEKKFTPDQLAKIKALSGRMPATTPVSPSQMNQMK